MKTTAMTERPRHMFAALWDLPNLMTLSGFGLSLSAIILAAQERYELAMMAALWAVVVDWLDGWVARQVSRRDPLTGQMGAQLDSFADLISSGIFPAVLVASLGRYSPEATALAVLIGAAGLLRLSFFNVYGVTDDGRVMGLPIAHNILVLALVMLARPWLDPSAFFWLLGSIALGLAALNVGWFYWPREKNSVIPWIVGYVAVMSLLLANIAPAA